MSTQGSCYLKSRLIYNHVNGGQVSGFFLHNKVRLENRLQAASRCARLAGRCGCGVFVGPDICYICDFLGVSGMLQQHDTKTEKKVERSFQHMLPYCFFWVIHAAWPRGCLMFQRWDAMHTMGPVFKFRLVVKSVSECGEIEQVHTQASVRHWKMKTVLLC